MNPVTLQAIGLMTGIMTSEKEVITPQVKEKVGKILGKLLDMVEKDVDLNWQQNYSSLIS